MMRHRGSARYAVRQGAVAIVEAYLSQGWSKTCAVHFAANHLRVGTSSIWRWLRWINGSPPSEWPHLLSMDVQRMPSNA